MGCGSGRIWVLIRSNWLCSPLKSKPKLASISFKTDSLIRLVKLFNDLAVDRQFLVESVTKSGERRSASGDQYNLNQGANALRFSKDTVDHPSRTYRDLLWRVIAELSSQNVSHVNETTFPLSADQPLFDRLAEITRRLCQNDDFDLVRPSLPSSTDPKKTVDWLVSNVGTAPNTPRCVSEGPACQFSEVTQDVTRSRVGLGGGHAEEREELYDFRELDVLIKELPSRILASQSKVGIASSGTTGMPKWVYHRMDTLARSVKISPKHRDDVWGLAYPPDRFAGMQVFLQAICNLNTIVSFLGLPPEKIHDAIEQYGVTHLSATPTLFRLLLSGCNKHENVRSITVGGEVCHSFLKDELRHVFPNAQFRNIYASTDSGAVFSSDGDSFVVSNEMKNLLRIENGQLWLHSTLVAESLRENCIDSYLWTGDEVEIVHQSPLTLRLLARESDWINVGGFKVNPHEVESALLQIDGVAEARVFPMRNSVVGYLVCAEIVLKNNVHFSVADIRRILSSRLNPYSIPRIIQFVNKISISPSGKKGRNS